jgi:hypothetical protein
MVQAMKISSNSGEMVAPSGGRRQQRMRSETAKVEPAAQAICSRCITGRSSAPARRSFEHAPERETLCRGRFQTIRNIGGCGQKRLACTQSSWVTPTRGARCWRSRICTSRLHSAPKSECEIRRSARPLHQSGTAVLPGKSAGFEPNVMARDGFEPNAVARSETTGDF